MGAPDAARRGQRDAEEGARTAEEDASVAAQEDVRTSWGLGGFVIWLVALSVHLHFAVSMVVVAFLLGNPLSSSSASDGPDAMLGPKRWVPSPCLVST